MDGKLFLGTAQFLQSKCTNEAAYRSAISRAYYACFIATRDIAFQSCEKSTLLRAQIKNERKIQHDKLLVYLKEASEKTVKKLGQDLAGLYGSRKDADYNMSAKITVDNSQDAIDEADAFLQALFKTPHKHIGKAVDDYIQKTHPGSA